MGVGGCGDRGMGWERLCFGMVCGVSIALAGRYANERTQWTDGNAAVYDKSSLFSRAVSETGAGCCSVFEVDSR